MEHSIQNKAVVLLGHGSSVHPSSSMPCRLHADTVRRLGKYHSVHCGFLKEIPMIEECLSPLDFDEVDEVLVLPFFLAEGYYTKKVIPQKLGLEGLPEKVKYLKPLGLDDEIQSILKGQAARAMGNWRQEETSLVLLGHGSTKSKTSKDTLLYHIEQLKKQTDFGQVTDLWLEEPPFIKDWREVVTQKNVLCIPYLIADGQHGGWDIPEMLGMQRDMYDQYKSHAVSGYQMKLTPALGKSQDMVNLILKRLDLSKV